MKKNQKLWRLKGIFLGKSGFSYTCLYLGRYLRFYFFYKNSRQMYGNFLPKSQNKMDFSFSVEKLVIGLSEWPTRWHIFDWNSAHISKFRYSTYLGQAYSITILHIKSMCKNLVTMLISILMIEGNLSLYFYQRK